MVVQQICVPCLYWGLVQLASAADFDSANGSSSLSPPAIILPGSLIGKTPASDSGFCGSSPHRAAKSKSLVDGTSYKSLKKNRMWAFKVAIV